ERLALVQAFIRVEDDRSSAETYQVVEVDDAGRITSKIPFNADQLDAATAELDQRYMASLPQPDVWVPAMQYVRAINARDWALLRADLTDDFVGVDHRPLGWGTLDADHFVDLYRSAVELAPDVWGGLLAVHAITASGCCVRAELRGTTSDGATFRTSATIVLFVSDAKWTGTAFFPEEQPERAMALLEGRDAATAILENAASRVAFSRVGFRGSVVAVRGRSLCLLHSTVVADGADSEILEVVEIDADGRLARGDVFDADQLDEAFALLDKRFIAGEARPYASAWSVTVELQRGLSDHDVARALSYTADDMPFEDHRPVGWGLLSRMEWARLYPPVFEQSPDVTWRIIADCDVSPHVAFVHFEMRGTRADGGAFISPMLGLFNIVDGLCRRIDIYVPEDLAAAEARFAELAAAHAELENDASRVAFSGVGYQGSVVAVRGRRLCLLHSTVTEVGRDSEVLEVVEIDDTHCVTRRIVFDCEHRDEAFALLDERFLAGEAAPFASTWRGGLAVVDGMNRHDLDAIRAATNDDVVLHDHRLVGWGSLEKDEYLALYPSIYDEVPDVRWLVLRELGLSERGAFAELDMCGTRPDGGTVSSPRLSVFEVRDGRCSRLDIYSPEDRAAAERRFAELTGAQAVFENAASRLGAATIARMFEGDWEGLARLFSDDVVICDHRPLVGGADVLGRAAATNGLRTLVELGVTEFSHRVLAVRGQRLCLTHSTVNAGDSGDEVLELDELDESGLEIRSDTFAYDQLDEAFALLDERFLAGEGAAHATKWRVLTEIADAMNRRDLDAIRNLVTRDFTMVDHRPASLGTASVDEWFAMFPVLYERSADVRWWTLADCRMSEHAVLRIHESRGTTREGGGEFSSPYYLVSEFRGDAPCRNDFYPLEEAAAAEARFAEIIDAANELANDATRAAAAHSDVVAIRGEHLCLVRHGDVLQLIETDDSGRVAGTDDFDPQQLDEAIALLDERFIAVLEPRCGAAWRAKARAVRAMNERDLSALRESMTPDLVLVDHRPLSFGTIGRDEYVRLFPPMWEQSPHVRWTMVRDHGVGERVACFLLGISGSTHEGGRFDIPVWNVITERDGLLARMEAFPDVAAASQRYDELVEAEADRALANAATRAVPTPHEVLAIRGDRLALTRSQADGHEVVRLTELDHLGALARHEDFEADELDAAYELLDERFLERLPTEGNGWRAWARAVRAMNARDLDGLRAAMTEDLVFVDHRALSFGTIDRERYLTLFPPMWDQSPDVRWTMVSDHGVGDHAACLFFRIHGTTNDGGLFDSPVWVIATDRDGLLAHMEAFPTADEATRRFDELVEAESGQTLANAATRVALTPHQVIAVRGDRLALTRSRAGGELPGHETLLVTELDPQGALVRNDAFQLEQLDAAVALLEERFLASLGAGGAGWAVLVRMIDAANRRSLDDLRNGMSEDFEIVDHRPLSLGTVDRDHYVASMKAMWDQSADTRFTVLCDHGVSASVVCFFVRVHGTTNDGGLFDNILWMTVVERDGKVAHMEDFLTREEAVARFAELAASPEPGLANAATRMAAAPHEVLALRGERLALTRSLLDGHEVLQLIELDEQGVLARSETFEMDHLAHALVELDERFLEGIDVQGGAWRAIARATEAMTRRDLDGVRSAMTEDFVFVDHRPLSFGTVDRERYLRLLAPLFDETPDVRWTMVSNHGITDHIACGLIRHSGTTNEGGRFDNPVWGVISERDQLWSRVEAFTTREEAVACFAELANARSDGLNNAATRAVAGAPEVLALRGDRLALTRTRADSHEIFRLTEVDASGAMTRNESFGVDQLDEAIARLEELFLAGEGAGNAAWATMAVVMAAVNARDLDALRALMTDDLLITDHRPLGWGTIGVDGFIGVHAALYEESDDARWTMIRDLRLSHDTICVQNQTAGTSEHGSDFVMGLVGVVVTRDGRMASMEAFPADDVAAALARFVELTADEPFGARNGSKANPVGGAT
ncbi:MAG: hypothetical protein QOC92_2776, partial [Acidimicrobiaceae bacterium]